MSTNRKTLREMVTEADKATDLKYGLTGLYQSLSLTDSQSKIASKAVRSPARLARLFESWASEQSASEEDDRFLGYFAGDPQDEDDESSFRKDKRCPQCHTRLNDGGTCPYCDDGDEEALQEDYLPADREIIEYPALEIQAASPDRWPGPSYTTYEEGPYDSSCDTVIAYDYEVDKQTVMELLGDYLLSDPEFADLVPDDESFSEWVTQYVDEHYDELFARYLKELRDYFEEDASQQATEEHYYDLVHGGGY